MADPPPAKRGLELYFTQHVAFSNAGGINNRLRKTDYPQLGGTQVFWGGGLQYRLNRLLLGLEVAHTVNPYGPRSNESATSRRSAYTLQLQAYYVVYKREHVRLYPFLGAGGMETSLTLTRTTADRDFNELLSQPGNAVSLTHFQNFINVGVGADIVLDKAGPSPLVNFRIGYRAGDRSEWFSDHTTVRNAPLDRLSNFYVQISLGQAWNRQGPRQRTNP